MIIIVGKVQNLRVKAQIKKFNVQTSKFKVNSSKFKVNFPLFLLILHIFHNFVTCHNIIVLK